MHAKITNIEETECRLDRGQKLKEHDEETGKNV